MNKTEEIAYLQKEITRLTNRLAKLDSEIEPTSIACGHDKILSHIRKLCDINKIKGISQIAYIDEEWGWTTTNIETRKIRKLLSEKDIKHTLEILFVPNVWESLSNLYHKEKFSIDDGIYKLFIEKGIIDEDLNLTASGVFLYTVTGHLCFNFSVKQDIETASRIFEQIFPITKTQYGEKLQMTYDEIMFSLKKNGGYEKLRRMNIPDREIKKYYDHTMILFG